MGDNVIFSTNETEISIDTSLSYISRYPMIGAMAQKVLDASMDFTQQHFPAAELIPIDLVETRKDIKVARSLFDFMGLMHESARHQYGEESGQDEPAISVQMDRREKILLLTVMRVEKEIAYKELTTPLAELQENELWNDKKMYMATSDLISPSEALEEHRAEQYKRAAKNYKISTSITSALELDLGG